MKRIFNLAIIMLAAMAAASCQKSVLDSENSGELVDVEFKIVTEDTMPTRAAGEATMHKELDQLVTRINHFGNGYEATASAKLVKGQKYDFVFWAQATDSKYYTIDPATAVVTVDYSDLAANNDLRDAFYACVQTAKVTENFSQTITLKRPFAQINVGTTDFAEAQKAGLDIDDLYSTMTVKNAATSLNTFTGKADNPVALTYAYAHAIAPEEDLVINKNLVQNTPNVEIADKYGWLAMNYILVADGTDNGEGTGIADVTFELREGADKVLALYDVPNVSVQRNFRTNIVGALLTAQGEISIIIDPIFTSEFVVD